jgi:hypothetical protein
MDDRNKRSNKRSPVFTPCFRKEKGLAEKETVSIIHLSSRSFEVQKKEKEEKEAHRASEIIPCISAEY